MLYANRSFARARAFIASTSRSRGGPVVSSDSRRRRAAVRNLVHRAAERRLVGLGRVREAAQLAHELQGRCVDLVVRRGRLEIEQRPDVSAHRSLLMHAACTGRMDLQCVIDDWNVSETSSAAHRPLGAPDRSGKLAGCGPFRLPGARRVARCKVRQHSRRRRPSGLRLAAGTATGAGLLRAGAWRWRRDVPSVHGRGGEGTCRACHCDLALPVPLHRARRQAARSTKTCPGHRSCCGGRSLAPAAGNCPRRRRQVVRGPHDVAGSGRTPCRASAGSHFSDFRCIRPAARRRSGASICSTCTFLCCSCRAPATRSRCRISSSRCATRSVRAQHCSCSGRRSFLSRAGAERSDQFGGPQRHAGCARGLDRWRDGASRLTAPIDAPRRWPRAQSVRGAPLAAKFDGPRQRVTLYCNKGAARRVRERSSCPRMSIHSDTIIIPVRATRRRRSRRPSCACRFCSAWRLPRP